MPPSVGMARGGVSESEWGSGRGEINGWIAHRSPPIPIPHRPELNRGREIRRRSVYDRVRPVYQDIEMAGGTGLSRPPHSTPRSFTMSTATLPIEHVSSNLSSGPKELFLATTSTTFGGNGGDAFADSNAVVDRGPITKIDVRHGNGIDAIRLYYGADGIGNVHGGNGGELTTFVVPNGERIIRVEGRSGHRIDQLQFFTDKGNKSDVFGGNGGSPFTTGDKPLGNLRTISGRSGNRLDQATFEFSDPYYIENITFDQNQLEQASIQEKPIELYTQRCENSTGVPQTVIYTHTSEVSAEKSYDFEEGASLTASAEFTVGVPEVAEGKASVSLTTTFKAGQSVTNIDTQTEQWSVPVLVPTDSTILATTMAKRYTCTVPFTYTVVWYRGDRSNKVKTMTYEGKYSGVNVAAIEHKIPESLTHVTAECGPRVAMDQ